MIVTDPYPAAMGWPPGDYAAPTSFEIHDAEPTRPYWIGLAVDLWKSTPLVRRVSLEPLDELSGAGMTVPPVGSDASAFSVPLDSHRVAVGRIVREVLETEGGEQQLIEGGWTIEFVPPKRRRRFQAAVSDTVGRRRRVSDAELRDTAESYRRHVAERRVVLAVWGELHARYAWPHPDHSDVVSRRIAAARDPRRGFLGPTKRGRKGEHKPS